MKSCSSALRNIVLLGGMALSMAYAQGTMSFEAARRVLTEAQIDESQYFDYLLDAIGRDNREVVELLLRAGVSMTEPDADGYTPFVYAALSGSKECIVAIIEHGADFPAILENDVETACRVARENGNEDCAQLIITQVKRVAGEMLKNAGITPELYDTALLRSAAQNEKTNLRLLLWAGVNVQAVDEDGETALVKAALNGHVDCLRMLLAADGVDVAGAGGKSGRTPLQAAVEAGRMECVKILLDDTRVSVNQTTPTHLVAPLHLALLRGKPAIAGALLSHKAIEISQRTDKTQTILHSAIASGNPECLKLVLERAHELCNAQDADGGSPLHMAVALERTELAKMLLKEADVDTKLRDNRGATPLLLAVRLRNEEMVKALLEYPDIVVTREVFDACSGEETAGIREMVKEHMMANVPKVLLSMGIEPKQYKSSLFQAVSSGDDLVFDLLLQARVSRNVVNEAGTPIVCEAARHGNIRALASLLKTPGCSLVATTKDGQHALHLAAGADKVECVRYLSELAPFLLFRVDHNGRIPLDVAAPGGPVCLIMEKAMVDHVLKSLKIQGDRETQLNAALFEFVQKNEARLLSLFLRAGADVNAKVGNMTILEHAIRLGRTDMVKLLLKEKGLELNELSDGLGALHVALVEPQLDIVKMLLEDSRIDVNKKDSDGETPLMWAIINVKDKEAEEELVDMFLHDERVHTDVRNHDGKAPIHLAIQYGLDSIVQKIIRRDASQVNYADAAGRTPLYIAAKYGNVKVLKRLLNHSRLNAEATTKDGKNPLHAAALNKHHVSLGLLVQSGRFDVNACDKMQHSPLYSAAEGGSLACVRVLLPRASLMALNMAIRIAVQKCHYDCSAAIGREIERRRQMSN